MGWIEKGRFKGIGVWVAEVRREGKWVASIEARPTSRVMSTSGPGSHVVPGKFATADAAVEAAHNYIVRMKQGT